MSLDGLIAELNDLYANGEGVRGTYLSGSASYGGMTEYSDVDFYVLTRDHHGMTERLIGSRKVEIRWRTEDEISLDIAKGGFFIYQMMDAQVSRDPHGSIGALITDAKERFETFIPPAETYKSLQLRLAEAKNKLVSATRYGDEATQGYLFGIYSPLLLETIFTIVSKPVAPPTVAWRWLDKLPGLNSEGVKQIKMIFGMPLQERIQFMIQQLDDFHGVVTRRLKG